MNSLLAALMLALILCRGVRAAPVAAPAVIPAPVEKVDASALTLLDQSARAYEAAQTLDITFHLGASGFAEARASRLLLRRPDGETEGDVHLQNSDGATDELWTNDRQWHKNQANFVWHSTQHYWKSNLFLGSDAANSWLLPLLGGKNPLRVVPSADTIQEITVLPAQVVRGQNCRGVRRRQWIYQNPKAPSRTVWRYLDHEVWLRADNSLLWEVRGQTLQVFEQKIHTEPALLEIQQARINPPLGADAFVYQLPTGARAPKADEPFWSRELRVGALPPVLAADLHHRTLKLSDFVGRPVVMWFGLPTDDGDLPVARQMARDWTPYGVQIVAVQMEYTQRKRDFDFPVVLSANGFRSPIIDQFGLQRAPFVLVLKRDGSIAALNPKAETLEPLLFDLLKAPDPASPAARDAATSQLAAQLFDNATRRATLQLWRERALPRPFSPDESARLSALLPTLVPFEASQLARVLARSHAEPQAPRIDAIVEAFAAAVRGPIPNDEPQFDRTLSPRAFVLREFLLAFAQFDETESATARQTLSRFGEPQNADVPDGATWLLMARAQCGDAEAARQLPALIESEADISNAKVMVSVLAQTAGAQAVPLLRALQSSSLSRFGQFSDPDARHQLNAAIRDELKLLEEKKQ